MAGAQTCLASHWSHPHPCSVSYPDLALLGFVKVAKTRWQLLRPTSGQQKIDLLLDMMAQAKPTLSMIQKTIVWSMVFLFWWP